MGYVAVRGGREAINEASRLFEFLRARSICDAPLTTSAVENQLRFLHSRVISEGGLYDPELCSLAIKQSLGDPLEAAFLLRAYRTTRPRLEDSPVHTTANMRMIRRISAAFKDVPGGQMLGPTPDYLLRLFRFELLDESPEAFSKTVAEWMQGMEAYEAGESFPKVVDALRAEGLLEPVQEPRKPFDITTEPLVFPLPRSAALSLMARAESGSILAIAYSNMRGYGDIHPTVAEMRVGYLPIFRPHPITKEPVEIGEVLITECEVISMHDTTFGVPAFGLGYGACFGHNEAKAISMAILDRALQKGARSGADNPSEDAEFVLLHIDGIESMGFATHYKMPHYVTFQSDLDRLRAAKQAHQVAQAVCS